MNHSSKWRWHDLGAVPPVTREKGGRMIYLALSVGRIPIFRQTKKRREKKEKEEEREAAILTGRGAATSSRAREGRETQEAS